MTKQEEIRLILYGVKIGQMNEDTAIKALDKLGVVIKVERELPESICAGCSCYFLVKNAERKRDILPQRVHEAGYEAVKLLTEKK